MPTTEEEKDKKRVAPVIASQAAQSSKEPLLLLRALREKEAKELSELVLHDNKKELEKTKGRRRRRPLP